MSFIQGTVIKNFGGYFHVVRDEAVYPCIAKGNILKNFKIIPGDIVQFTPNDASHQSGVITEVLDRKNELARPAIANLDQLVFIFAINSPKPDLLLLDKLLLISEIKEIPAVICINKMDLDKEKDLEKIKNDYQQAGYEVIPLIAREGAGIERLMAVLSGKVSVFAGQSGVGKSTLINKILKGESLKTGEISDKTQRGKHTTKHVEFVKIKEDTYIADTPGFSLVDPILIESQRLDMHYPEFRKHLEHCRFIGCSHVNEPSCSIKDAVLKGFIPEPRYARYKTLMAQIKESEKLNRKW